MAQKSPIHSRQESLTFQWLTQGCSVSVNMCVLVTQGHPANPAGRLLYVLLSVLRLLFPIYFSFFGRALLQVLSEMLVNSKYRSSVLLQL